MPLKIIIPPAKIELKAKQITKAVRGALQLLANTARADIRNSPGGPGNAPKSRTGALASSIRTSARRTSGKVTAKAAYALALEAGASGGGGVPGIKSLKSVKGLGRTKRGVAQTARKMAARPFLSKALEEKEPEIERRLTRAIMQDLTWKETK